jgi:DNA-binding NarL/FixJ family response regulator
VRTEQETGATSAGFCTKAIAAKMGVSEAGAKKHVDGLRRRHDAANRAELVRRAFEAGDLSVEAAPDMPVP